MSGAADILIAIACIAGACALAAYLLGRHGHYLWRSGASLFSEDRQ